jgi:predicted Zn-dependent protease
MVPHTGREDLPWEFKVLNSKQINAFALPGGFIYVNRGLIERAEHLDELAGALAHEVGHVVGRHGAEHLAKAGLTQGLVGAVAIGSYDPDNPDRSAQVAAMAQVIGQLVNLRYGREDELESDALGVKFMAEGGYDPRGMVHLMHVLGEASGGRRAPEFFNTHPSPENRIERLRQLAWDTADGGEVGEERFAQRVLARLAAVGGAGR